MSATRFHAELNGKESDMAQPMYDGNGDLPDWFDQDLHGNGLKVLSGDWKTLGDIKPLLGEYANKAADIMRDLCALGLVECESRSFEHYNGFIGSKAYYRLSESGVQPC